MARKVIYQLVDDLDGTVLDEGAGETVAFSIDGVDYEIDLSDANAKKLRDFLAPYSQAGRSLGKSSRRGYTTTNLPAAKSPKAKSGRADLQLVREWARAQGHEVSDRGRVPRAIIEAYDAAQV